MNPDKVGGENAVLDIVKEKFRQGENVVSICESYQIFGTENKNRLLALVESNNLYGLFSFAASKWPPELFSDLTIDCVYPLNEHFKLDTNIPTGSISQYQFKIISNNEQFIYYYYPFNLTIFKSFSDFHEDVSNAWASYLKNMNTPVDNSNNVDRPIDKPPEFKWLEAYKREDQSAIDRSIADGTVTLKKRESKFREELERHEYEYIVHKDFCIYTATWNVNGRPCPDISLNAWLSATEEPPDIYAVAFQELDLSPKAITFSESRPDPIWMWELITT